MHSNKRKKLQYLSKLFSERYKSNNITNRHQQFLHKIPHHRTPYPINPILLSEPSSSQKKRVPLLQHLQQRHSLRFAQELDDGAHLRSGERLGVLFVSLGHRPSAALSGADIALFRLVCRSSKTQDLDVRSLGCEIRRSESHCQRVGSTVAAYLGAIFVLR